MTLGSMALAMLLINPCNAFSSSPNRLSPLKTETESSNRVVGPLYSSRRSFINTSAATIFSTVAAVTIVSPNDIANAMPMVTLFEFEQILKDSGKIL